MRQESAPGVVFARGPAFLQRDRSCRSFCCAVFLIHVTIPVASGGRLDKERFACAGSLRVAHAERTASVLLVHGLDGELEVEAIGIANAILVVGATAVAECAVGANGWRRGRSKQIVNALDTVAGFVAGELKASKLLLLTDVPGIFNEEKK